MGELRDGLYSAITINRRRPNSYIGERYPTVEEVLNLSAPIGEIEALCCDHVVISRTAGFAKTLNADKSSRKCESAVYVIHAPEHDVCKIGISTSPGERLAGLQQSHWTRLELYSVAWSPTRKAETVEQEALRVAAECGKRLIGEWVKMSPAEAFQVVIDAAKTKKVPLCDSGTWLRNWNARMESLRQANLPGVYRRAA
jgi:hypothetical protein